MTLHRIEPRTACRICGAPGYCLHSTPGAMAAAQIPADPRVLRIVLALADLYVIDHSGGAPLWHYGRDEIADALDFLEYSTAAQRATACAAARWCNGAPDPRVVRFPRRGVHE